MYLYSFLTILLHILPAKLPSKSGPCHYCRGFGSDHYCTDDPTQRGYSRTTHSSRISERIWVRTLRCSATTFIWNLSPLKPACLMNFQREAILLISKVPIWIRIRFLMLCFIFCLPDLQASLGLAIIVGGLGVTAIAQMTPLKGDTHERLIRVESLKGFD
jgi:hypothetical protein